jgi:adenosylmethionine-8-amino-7-oxononanoate aminotransferase
MPYTQMSSAPLAVPVVRTEDVYWILADGRRLIDGLASWWTACHGYNHPKIAQAVSQQLQVMPHVMFGGVHHEPALRLARRLAGLLPGSLKHVFFCDSGSVSVEVAMKIAVQFWLNQGQRRVKFISFQNAYHGDTTGAMSVCDPLNSMHSHFKGFLPEQFSCPVPGSSHEIGQFDSFVKSRRESVAAVIIEPLVQGAGGMKFHSPESLAAIRRICDRHGLLLIADEIATGFGRTGSMFACQQAGIVPDIICLGKALTGGTISLAATVATDHVYDAFLSPRIEDALMHGPTYMANPLACAAANASLDLFETEPRLEQARAMENILRDALSSVRQVPGVVDVRCLGAIGVIQVERLHSLHRLRGRLVDEGVWLRPFRDMIYLTPPLSIAYEPLSQLCDSTLRVVREWSQWE